MNEKKLNSTHLNNKGFTLVELIISIFIGSIIIFGVNITLMDLYKNIAEVDDGISIVYHKKDLKVDLEYIKRYYPTLAYMTGGIYANNKFGFSAMIFEDENFGSGILIGVTDGKKILTGFQEKYDDFHIFYKEIDASTKDLLINSFNTDYSSENSYIYKDIHPIKFTFLSVNNIWKIDITSSGIYYKDNFGKNIVELGNDLSILWYNISFLIH